MKILLTILAATFLIGCNQKPPLQAYADNQVYEGYPCGDNCDAFAKGYKAAEQAGFTSEEQCGEGFETTTMGCKVYVAEFEIEQKEYDEIMRDFNNQWDMQ